MPRRTAGWRRCSPALYGAGQLMHIIGLVWSGGYGVQRKVAGAEQVLRSGGEIAGMGLMGLGGLIAIVGGLLFVVRGDRAAARQEPAMIKRLQFLLRWLFMRVEALFNAAFGDRLNPLYHLGAITFFLFWLVAGSGLYLYAFFETGVAGAYASVEALTHGQWYAGGIMRSVHRYASDAMVLTMLLHMLRHFAFDRLRGFRWFSWVSGVALIWRRLRVGHQRLHAALGPAGAVRHRRRLRMARLAAWLRRHADPQLHLPVQRQRPLLLAAVLHAHRHAAGGAAADVDPRAARAQGQDQPAAADHGRAWLLTLLALALVKPVLSQGGAASLGVSPVDLQLDWFYLAVFPLLYLWPLGQVWALLGAATALARGAAVAAAELQAEQGRAIPHDGAPTSPQPVAVRAGETLLDAGLRAGLALPYECRNGGCGVCLCTVLHGSVDHGAYQRSALPDAMRARGEALMCCATPLSDLEIEVVRTTGVARAAINTYVGRVDALERLADDLIRLTVSLPGGERIDLHRRPVHQHRARRRATARILVRQRATRQRAHRIACSAHSGRPLHRTCVHRDEGRRHAALRGPAGRLHAARERAADPVRRRRDRLRADQEHRRGRVPPRRCAGRCGCTGACAGAEDLYMADLAERWQREHDNFHFVPVLSDAEPADAWTGRLRPGPRSDARGLSRPERLRGLRVRFGEDGRGGGAGVHRTGPGRGPVFLRRVHAVGRTARVATGLSILRGRDSPSAPAPRRRLGWRAVQEYGRCLNDPGPKPLG